MKTTIAILAVLTSLLICLLIGTAIGYPQIGLALFALDILAVVVFTYNKSPLKNYSLYSACGVASAAILFDCTYPLVGGTVDVMYIANRADIASVTKNGSNTMIIEAFTMVSLKKFYKLEGASGSSGSSVGARMKSVQLPYGKAFEHEIDALSFKVDPATKKELEAWNQADLVAIVQNKYRGSNGNTAFEVFGYDGGLQLVELERDANDKDTMGAFKLKFKTQESSREAHMPYSFFTTDYATTLAAVNALIA